MGPASLPFGVVLIVGFVGLAYVTAFRKAWWLKIGAALLSFLVASAFGISIVNDYYGYYRTWGDLATDLSGGPAGTKVSLGQTLPGRPGSRAYDTTPLVLPTPKPGHGLLLDASFPGPLSHITRSGYIYLPAAYFDPAYAHTRFPVLELFHGAPGRPADWLTNLGVTGVLETEIASHRALPMVLVIPDAKGGPPRSDDCVNAYRGDQDDTYLTEDVPDDIIGRIRIYPLGPHWATMGFSTGGYCAVNLAVRHPRSYGGAASFDGYFHSSERAYTGDLFQRHTTLINANSPIYVLAHQVVTPLPKFWLQVGTGDTEDTADTFAFHDLVEHLESVPLIVEPGARHNYPSWERALPAALDWASGVVNATSASRVNPASNAGIIVENAPPTGVPVVPVGLHPSLHPSVVPRAAVSSHPVGTPRPTEVSRSATATPTTPTSHPKSPTPTHSASHPARTTAPPSRASAPDTVAPSSAPASSAVSPSPAPTSS